MRVHENLEDYARRIGTLWAIRQPSNVQANGMKGKGPMAMIHHLRQAGYSLTNAQATYKLAHSLALEQAKVWLAIQKEEKEKLSTEPTH